MDKIILFSYSELASCIRQETLSLVFQSKSSHIGSCLSSIDLLTILFFKKTHKLDYIILSKGHAAAALYATLYIKGLISKEQLSSFNNLGSFLLGHANHYLPGIKFSTGSLGHGLSLGCGVAIACKKDNRSTPTYVIASDGELNEGSYWEAILFAGHHQLHSLTLIIDYNKIQSLGEVKTILDLEPLKAKFESFNWLALEIDGHNHQEIENALQLKSSKPKAIIAHTIKGKGVSFMENKLEWHYKNPTETEYEQALAELRE